MKSRRTKLASATLACGAAALLAACSSSASSSSSAGAADAGSSACGGASGTVTWYTTLEAQADQEIVQAFNAQCSAVHISVVALAGTSTLWPRFQQEEAAGIDKADVVSLSDWGTAEEAVQDKYVVKLPAGVIPSSFPTQFKDPDGYWFATRVLTIGISYNKNLVSAADVPKSWADLLNPKWKGKIAILDPRKNAAGYAAEWQLANTPGLGLSWFKQLKSQSPGIFAQSGQLGNALVSGQYAIGITTDDETWTQHAAGAPVAVQAPSEGSGVNHDENMLAADGPNPKGAVAFLTFLASTAGGEATAKATFDYSPLSGVPAYPSGRAPLNSISLLKENDKQEAADKTALTNQIVTAVGMS